MRFLSDYITEFAGKGTKKSSMVARGLKKIQQRYDVFSGGNPRTAFGLVVHAYNLMGRRKAAYGISDNLARNIPGALLQDYLVNLMVDLCRPYPKLEVVTEVRIPFGVYPLWKKGAVTFESPAEQSDIAIGYMMNKSDRTIVSISEPPPKKPIYGGKGLVKDTTILPLVTINSKIRVSQSEFFDWQGRELLMTKGNPNCFSIQVAMRKEMDMSIVDAAQAYEKFFLLGDGPEKNVKPDFVEFDRLIKHVEHHLAEKLT